MSDNSIPKSNTITGSLISVNPFLIRKPPAPREPREAPPAGSKGKGAVPAPKKNGAAAPEVKRENLNPRQPPPARRASSVRSTSGSLDSYARDGSVGSGGYDSYSDSYYDSYSSRSASFDTPRQQGRRDPSPRGKGWGGGEIKKNGGGRGGRDAIGGKRVRSEDRYSSASSYDSYSDDDRALSKSPANGKEPAAKTVRRPTPPRSNKAVAPPPSIPAPPSAPQTVVPTKVTSSTLHIAASRQEPAAKAVASTPVLPSSSSATVTAPKIGTSRSVILPTSKIVGPVAERKLSPPIPKPKEKPAPPPPPPPPTNVTSPTSTLPRASPCAMPSTSGSAPINGKGANHAAKSQSLSPAPQPHDDTPFATGLSRSRSVSKRHRSDEPKRGMCYPCFDGTLPYRKGAIPFLSYLQSGPNWDPAKVPPRRRLTTIPPPRGKRADSEDEEDTSVLPTLPASPPGAQLVAYGEYVVHKVLGKGIGSIVVLVSRIDSEGPPGVGAAAGPIPLGVSNNTKSQIIIPAVAPPTFYALKIFRGQRTYDDAAEEEAAFVAVVLKQSRSQYLMPVIERVSHPSHCALLFPLCGQSIYGLLEENRRAGLGRGLPHSLAKAALYQLLCCVRDLHASGVIHTDIKPENIMFRATDTFMGTLGGGDGPDLGGRRYIRRQIPDPSGATNADGTPLVVTIKERVPSSSSNCRIRLPSSNGIYLIDLGNAAYKSDLKAPDTMLGSRPKVGTSVIQTRHYRAPEVVFEAGWDHQSDIWSVGCIITELLTGDALFPMHDEVEHIALMEKALGPIPLSLYCKTVVAREHCYTKPAVKGDQKDGQPKESSSQPEATPALVSATPPPQGSSITTPTTSNVRTITFAVEDLYAPRSAATRTPKEVPYLRLRASSVKRFSRAAAKAVDRQKSVRELIERNVDGEEGRRLADLAYSLMHYDPCKRLTAVQALDHPYFCQPW